MEPVQRGDGYVVTGLDTVTLTRRLVQDGPVPILKARLPAAPHHPRALDRLVHHAEIITIDGDSYRRRVVEAAKRKPPRSGSES